MVPLKLKKKLEKFGARNVQELGWWDNTILKNIKIHSVPVQHWSKRSMTDTNQSLWCGWVIEAPELQNLISVGIQATQKTFQFNTTKISIHGSFPNTNWRLRTSLVYEISSL